jgi:hypothetical protein
MRGPGRGRLPPGRSPGETGRRPSYPRACCGEPPLPLRRLVPAHICAGIARTAQAHSRMRGYECRDIGLHRLRTKQRGGGCRASHRLKGAAVAYRASATVLVASVQPFYQAGSYGPPRCTCRWQARRTVTIERCAGRIFCAPISKDLEGSSVVAARAPSILCVYSYTMLQRGNHATCDMASSPAAPMR